MNPKTTASSPEAPKKKAYSSPVLQVYGDLAQVTSSVMRSVGGDGGTSDARRFTR